MPGVTRCDVVHWNRSRAACALEFVADFAILGPYAENEAMQQALVPLKDVGEAAQRGAAISGYDESV